MDELSEPARGSRDATRSLPRRAELDGAMTEHTRTIQQRISVTWDFPVTFTHGLFRPANRVLVISGRVGGGTVSDLGRGGDRLAGAEDVHAPAPTDRDGHQDGAEHGNESEADERPLLVNPHGFPFPHADETSVSGGHDA